jgi:hypothetical protein
LPVIDISAAKKHHVILAKVGARKESKNQVIYPDVIKNAILTQECKFYLIEQIYLYVRLPEII